MRGEDYIVQRYFSCVFEAMTPFKSLINSARDLSPFEWATLNDLWDYAKLNQPPTREEQHLYWVSELAVVPPALSLTLSLLAIFVNSTLISLLVLLFFSLFLVKSFHCCLISVDDLCLYVGVCACGLRARARVCMRTPGYMCLSVTKCFFSASEYACALRVINLQVFIWLTSQKVIELVGNSLEVTVVFGAEQTDIYTPIYGLRFALDPCHPRHPFLATVSLALLSFPPTPPCYASLPLPLLSCFKSSSFP